MSIINIAVGQEVAIEGRRAYAPDYSFGWTVSKITPSGQVVVTRERPAMAPGGATEKQERRFKMPKWGDRIEEMGKNDWDWARLELDVPKAREIVATHERKQAAVSAFRAFHNRVHEAHGFNAHWEKSTMQERVNEIESFLTALKLAVAAI